MRTRAEAEDRVYCRDRVWIVGEKDRGRDTVEPLLPYCAIVIGGPFRACFIPKEQSSNYVRLIDISARLVLREMIVEFNVWTLMRAECGFTYQVHP